MQISLSKYADDNVALEDAGLVYLTREREDHLNAILRHDAILVEDTDGGVWCPDREAAVEIAASADPMRAAVVMCDEDPMRGEWHQ